MIKIFIARNPTEAHLVQGLLQAKGIQAEVRGESLFSVEGGASVAGMLPSVWVPGEREQVEVAERILARYRGQGPVFDGSPWTCQGCGEVHGPQFTDCWRCGAQGAASGAEETPEGGRSLSRRS